MLDCNEDTLCELIFAGNGIFQLTFNDGHEDSFGLKFIGLGEANDLVKNAQE